MGQRKTEHTGTVAVVAEDGTRHTIDEYTNFTQFVPLSGSSQWVRGARFYELDGEHCNVLDDTTFQVVATDQILRRV